MKRDLPSLNAVRMFEAAARTQSFTRAASELHVTQGAVSRQIALLEDQLGCKLFERKGPQLTLTDAGRQYQSVVEDALETIRMGTLKITQDREATRLTISILPSFGTHWLMPRMPALEQALPHLSIRLVASHRPVDFSKDQEIDLAIRMGKGNWPEVYRQQITHNQLYPVCTPALAERIQSIEDLLQQRLIGELLPYDEWQRWFKHNKVKFRPREERTYDDTGIQIQAALDGLGVILARDDFVRNHLLSGRLVRLFDSSILSEFQFFFVCPPSRITDPDIKAFHDWIIEAAESV